MIVAIWVLTLAVNTPVLATYRAVVDELTGTSGCMSTSELASRRLYAMFFAFAYVIPLTIIAVCSLGILRHNLKQFHPSCHLNPTNSLTPESV